MRAMWNGAVLADSDDTIVIDVGARHGGFAFRPMTIVSYAPVSQLTDLPLTPSPPVLPFVIEQYFHAPEGRGQ